MLRELHISNLAVISDARIEFHRGLNCFTGTTGAGKSLVIGAIELLLGLRSAAEMLRPGADEGRVSGLFDIRDANLLQTIESATDVPVTGDGGELLITRRLHSSGRTSVSLNGNPITLNMLKQVSEALVDVHGQHDHQYLLKPANQIDVLDQFADLWPARKAYAEVYSKLHETQRRLSDLSANRTLREQQLELYRFQAGEIDAAELDPAEYEELRARASVLENLEKLKRDVGATHGALYETDGSILERLKMMAAVLSELSELDQSLKSIATNVRDATLQLEDTAFDMGRYLDKLDLDPSELAEVVDRLNTVNRLVNKYGDPVSQTLDYREEIGRKIAELERATDNLGSLQAELEPLKDELKAHGAALTKARQVAAKKLSPLIKSQLGELGMDKATFSVAVTSVISNGDSTDALASGFDQVEFIVQTNPGQTAQPLRRIASGGELSRIMLALKGILVQGERVSVLVFDEIDANVGGRLGSVIGSKLRKLAERHQVLCITHLPQIASYADRHLTVRKQSEGDQTRTTVREITGAEQLEELAEMIGGQRITATTRAQAQELLEGARVANPNEPKRASRSRKVKKTV